MRECNIVGIDLAKNIFHVCVMNSKGRVLRRKKVSRSQLYEYVVNNCDGIVALEACSGSHYWARRFESLGFEVRQIAAQFVKPFVKTNKNDVVDAEAICEAASREQMRFVSTRTEAQQDIQNLHRIRERLVRQRTALVNEVRGFLSEYGIIVAQGINNIRRNLPSIIEEHSEQSSALWVETFRELYEELCALDRRIEHYEARLQSFAREDSVCQRLLKIDGVGYITATAVVAAVGNPKDFKNGRSFAASLGLVPSQTGTGGRVVLGRITKRGDKYIRKLLVQGARANARAMQRRKNNPDPDKQEFSLTAQWFQSVAHRRGQHRALVALANKTARRIWVVLCGNEFKQPEKLLQVVESVALKQAA